MNLNRPISSRKPIKRLPRAGGETEFLSHQRSRLSEAMRVFRIALEFVKGFRAFHFLPPAVTVFGSARFNENHRYYDLARKVGAGLAREGFVVVTGGGPGIMEAANRGAKEAGGTTVGANILLPFEQRPNPYLDRFVNFNYFFARKVILVKYSYAFIILPGGFGTLDEFSEALTLIQTGKLYDFPIVLMGTEYWEGFWKWLTETMVEQGTIAAEDLELVSITDDPDEAVRIVAEMAKRLKLPVERPLAKS